MEIESYKQTLLLAEIEKNKEIYNKQNEEINNIKETLKTLKINEEKRTKEVQKEKERRGAEKNEENFEERMEKIRRNNKGETRMPYTEVVKNSDKIQKEKTKEKVIEKKKESMEVKEKENKEQRENKRETSRNRCGIMVRCRNEEDREGKTWNTIKNLLDKDKNFPPLRKVTETKKGMVFLETKNEEEKKEVMKILKKNDRVLETREDFKNKNPCVILKGVEEGWKKDDISGEIVKRNAELFINIRDPVEKMNVLGKKKIRYGGKENWIIEVNQTYIRH